MVLAIGDVVAWLSIQVRGSAGLLLHKPQRRIYSCLRKHFIDAGERPHFTSGHHPCNIQQGV